MPHTLHVRARDFARDPTEVVLRRGNFAVQSQRGFNSDQRPAGAHEVAERLR